MADARHIQIADAVKAALDAVDFDIDVTITRGYLAFFNLESAPEDPAILVAPGPTNIDSAAGGLESDALDFAINIALIRRAENDAEADECIKVTEDIYFTLRNSVMAGGRCITKQIPLVYDEESLRDQKTFRSVMRFIFRRVE